MAGELHRAALPVLCDAAFATAAVTPAAVTGVACTVGPGLAPCLAAGRDFARATAARLGVPFYAVHHMEAHLLTARMAAAVPVPFLVLLASGGHCLLVHAEALGVYRRLGTTLDDSPGEAYDKVARALGLAGGGAALEAVARAGDAGAVLLATPLQRVRSCDFSFAGLKTSIFRHVYGEGYTGATMQAGLRDAARWVAPSASDATLRANLAAAFQAAVCRHLAVRTTRAIVSSRQHLVIDGP